MDIMLWSGYGILIFYTFFLYNNPLFHICIQRKNSKNCRKLKKKSSKITVYTIASKKGKNKQTNKETDNLNRRVKVSTERRLQFTSTEQYICLKRGGF